MQLKILHTVDVHKKWIYLWTAKNENMDLLMKAWSTLFNKKKKKHKQEKLFEKQASSV